MIFFRTACLTFLRYCMIDAVILKFCVNYDDACYSTFLINIHAGYALFDAFTLRHVMFFLRRNASIYDPLRGRREGWLTLRRVLAALGLVGVEGWFRHAIFFRIR